MADSYQRLQGAYTVTIVEPVIDGEVWTNFYPCATHDFTVDFNGIFRAVASRDAGRMVSPTSSSDNSSGLIEISLIDVDPELNFRTGLVSSSVQATVEARLQVSGTRPSGEAFNLTREIEKSTVEGIFGAGCGAAVDVLATTAADAFSDGVQGALLAIEAD